MNRIVNGDILRFAAHYRGPRFHAVLCDPPYELGFMGKSWDSRGVSFRAETWAAIGSLLAPGAHLLAFGGTRTFHRIAVAIEDAGFEIRDTIGYMYGSGFPKSHDVSKAIDKIDAAEAQHARRLRFTEWVRSTGVTESQIREATGSYMGRHYCALTSQPSIMTTEHLEACRHLFADVPTWVEEECRIRTLESENFKSREVVGRSVGVNIKKARIGMPNQSNEQHEFNITAPATDDARAWQGYGTALKPAWEPVIVARKPLSGTVAQNCLAHGCGAINVDGARVGDELRYNSSAGNKGGGSSLNMSAFGMPQNVDGRMSCGRWPANIIHDGSEETAEVLGDAARFFYTAKASAREREAGLDGFEAKSGLVGNKWTDQDYRKGHEEPSVSRRNHHPTVKPLALTQYLATLILPPPHVESRILVPFAGSGSECIGAALAGWRTVVGVEREAEYAAIARARLEHWTKPLPA